MNTTLKALALSASLSLCLFSQTSAPTQITGTLTNSDGSNFTGTLRISWPTFSIGSTTHPSSSMLVSISNGAVNLSLYPTDAMSPSGVVYTVTLQELGYPTVTSSWSVPTSSTPVDISTIYTPPGTGSGQGGGSMVYPAAGVARSTGTAWTSSLSVPFSVANGGTGTSTPALVSGNAISITGTWPNQTIAVAAPLAVAYGGTGTATPALVAGTNVTISGTWPNQTINSSPGVTFPLSVANGGTGTASPGLVAGNNVTISGTWPNQTIASAGGSTRTWLFSAQGVCQSAIAGAAIWLPTSNAAAFNGCTTTNQQGEWGIAAGNTTANWGFQLVVPAGATGAWSMTLTYRTADTTTSHAIVMQPSYACVGAGSSPDNPSYTNLSTFTLNPVTSASVNENATFSFTPTCSAGSQFRMLFVASSNTFTSAATFSYQSIAMQASN